MGLSPEVLIYIQTVKDFMKVNEEAFNYFRLDKYSNEFYEELAVMSQENSDNGDEIPLTIPQFEELRGKILKNKLDKIEEGNWGDVNKIFINIPDHGKICLN